MPLTRKQQQIAADARKPYADAIQALTVERDQLRASNAELLDALRWYANNLPFADGNRARAAIAKTTA